MRNGAAHPLDEPHEEERRAHVAERALGEAELVARVVRPASSTGRRTLETTAAGSISLWTREGRGAEGARKGEYATMERGTSLAHQTTSSSCRKASASSGVHSESKVTREHAYESPSSQSALHTCSHGRRGARTRGTHGALHTRRCVRQGKASPQTKCKSQRGVGGRITWLSL